MDITEIKNTSNNDLISISEDELSQIPEDQFQFFVNPNDYKNYDKGFDIYIEDEDIVGKNNLLLFFTFL